MLLLIVGVLVWLLVGAGFVYWLWYNSPHEEELSLVVAIAGTVFWPVIAWVMLDNIKIPNRKT